MTWWDLHARWRLLESSIHLRASAAQRSLRSRSKKMDSRMALVSADRASPLGRLTYITFWKGDGRLCPNMQQSAG